MYVKTLKLISASYWCRLYSSGLEKEDTHLKKNVNIHDYNDNLKDRLGQKTIGTIETETRKMSGVKLLFRKIWVVMKVPPSPVLEWLSSS